MSSFSKRQKEMFLLVIASVFLVVLGAYSYVLVFSPAKEEYDRLEQAVEQERATLFALRTQAAEKKQTDSTSTLRFQQKVPVKPLQDAVLLQINKAEIKSDAVIKNVNFTESGFAIVDPPEHVENVSRLLTTVEVEVEKYQDLVKFIDEIEKMERIFVIYSINFQGLDEVIEAETEEKLIALTVSFSAFYRPDLKNLEEEVPKINAPPSSQKTTPFPYNEGGK